MSEETPEASDASPEVPADAPSTVEHHRRRSRILRGALAVFVVLVLVISGGVAYAYHHLQGNITVIQDNPTVGGGGVPRPVAQSASPSKNGGKAVKHAPVNILILGSDTREGDNSFIGGDKSAGHSDTAIVLHLSASRKWAVGVSIPRDSMVQIPPCKKPDGSISQAQFTMFNEAYTIGGALCARDTVEQLTHLRMDHFLVVDFAGFRSMVSALGGVNVCLPEPVQDSYTHLDLPAGKQKLSGNDALQYVRLRHIGSGSDLDRIKRQQAFISSLIQQVTAGKMLFHVTNLYSFLDAATKSLTTDPGLGSPRKLAGLGEQVRSIGLDNIQFVTVPTEAYAPDPNRLQWTSGAQTLWDLLKSDEPLPGTAAAKPSATASATPTPSATGSPLMAAPSTINVRVLNGAGVQGAAGKAADQLRALGYHVVSIGTTAKVTTTVVRWSPPRDESARTLAAATGATTEQTTGLGQVVELVVGPDYVSAQAVTVASPTTSASSSPSSTFGGRTAAESICSN